MILKNQMVEVNKSRPSTTWASFERKAAPYLFVSPFFIIFAIFFVFPIAFAVYMSFTEWRGIGTPGFIGVENYLSLLTAADFHLVLRNTLWYAIGSLLTILPFAFIVALMLNTKWNRFRESFRLIYFLPSITSVIVIGIIFSLLYDVHYGLFNWILSLFGIPPVKWLDSRQWFKASVLIMMVWRWIGYNAVYFLAGLQNVPPELHEAAEIDGASWFQRLFRITIPLLRPVLLFVLIIEIISNFQLFEDVYILGNGDGGPADAGLTIAQYLYRSGFVYGQMGYASAIGVTLALIIFVVSWIQLRGFGTFREY